MTTATVPAFPVDDATLERLWGAIHPGPDAERSRLFELLEELSDGSFGPAEAAEEDGVAVLDQPRWHHNDVISALIVEVRRLRGTDEA